MSKKASPSELDRQAAAEGQLLVDRVGALKFHLQPRQIAGEAVAQVKGSLRNATRFGSAHAKTPAGLATAVTCIGFIAAAVIARQQRGRRAPETVSQPKAPAAAPADPLRALGGLALALGIGLGVRKLAAGASREDELLGSFSNEVKSAMDRWAREQVQHLGHPGPDKGFGLLNVIAMGLGLFSAPRDPHDPTAAGGPR